MLNKKINALSIAVAFILCGSIALAAESATIKISPAKLGIGAFFGGEDITLSGSLPSDGDIIIEVIGPQENAKFYQRPGRAFLDEPRQGGIAKRTVSVCAAFARRKKMGTAAAFSGTRGAASEKGYGSASEALILDFILVFR